MDEKPSNAEYKNKPKPMSKKMKRGVEMPPLKYDLPDDESQASGGSIKIARTTTTTTTLPSIISVTVSIPNNSELGINETKTKITGKYEIVLSLIIKILNDLLKKQYDKGLSSYLDFQGILPSPHSSANKPNFVIPIVLEHFYKNVDHSTKVNINFNPRCKENSVNFFDPRYYNHIQIELTKNDPELI